MLLLVAVHVHSLLLLSRCRCLYPRVPVCGRESGLVRRIHVGEAVRSYFQRVPPTTPVLLLVRVRVALVAVLLWLLEHGVCRVLLPQAAGWLMLEAEGEAATCLLVAATLLLPAC